MNKLSGPTYLFRSYLILAGCRWNGIFWTTPLDEKILKVRLTNYGMQSSDLRKIKVEEILKKPLDIKTD